MEANNIRLIGSPERIFGTYISRETKIENKINSELISF